MVPVSLDARPEHHLLPLAFKGYLREKGLLHILEDSGLKHNSLPNPFQVGFGSPKGERERV